MCARPPRSAACALSRPSRRARETSASGSRSSMPELDVLRHRLHEIGNVIVAFSGGADSAFLAFVANDTLGASRVVAATAVSPSLAGDELADCRALADEWGLRSVEVATEELDNDSYQANDGDRCYWCKSSLMDALTPLADSSGAVVVLGV